MMNKEALHSTQDSSVIKDLSCPHEVKEGGVCVCVCVDGVLLKLLFHQ